MQQRCPPLYRCMPQFNCAPLNTSAEGAPALERCSTRRPEPEPLGSWLCCTGSPRWEKWAIWRPLPLSSGPAPGSKKLQQQWAYRGDPLKETPLLPLPAAALLGRHETRAQEQRLPRAKGQPWAVRNNVAGDRPGASLGIYGNGSRASQMGSTPHRRRALRRLGCLSVPQPPLLPTSAWGIALRRKP